MFCCMVLYVNSSIAIILMGKRGLVALLYLSSCCLVMVEWLFLAVSWGCLRFVIVVFSDHTHLLFFYRRKMSVKIQELEDLLEQQRQRASNLEKAKNRLTAELREVTIELENVS